MRRAWAGWRLALRLARRDALRSRGRSILVLVMIALPVTAVVATAVLSATIDVNTREGLDRTLGTRAAALLEAGDRRGVTQGVDPRTSIMSTNDGDHRRATAAQIRAVLGDRPMTRVEMDAFRPVRTDRGIADGTRLVEADPSDPLTSGLFRLTAGRMPRTTGEVVVNQYLADRGPGLGEPLASPSTMHGPDRTLRVVGVGDAPDVKNAAAAFGLPGAFGLQDEGTTSWLVGGGPVTWGDVVALNRIGVTALSRAVVLDPPAAALAHEPTSSGGTTTVLVLIVVMAVIEVVLLAGPAFAVGARRQSRTLALMASAGSSPRQARRVVLASGVVLGVAAAVLGVVLGLVGSRLLVPLAQAHSSDWLGPFQIPWLQVAGVAGFGLLSAVLAALVPAWIASRQDVVAVLAGRRGDRRPSLRSPILGLLLLGAGVAGAVLSTRRQGGGEVYIAAAAILCVLGMVLLVPVVVVAVSRLAAGLPLPLRFAARDAARHRTRTAPAVAAVAATVAGVVALGIGTASDQKEKHDTYTPQLAMGHGYVAAAGLSAADWAKARATVARYAPDVAVSTVTGVPQQTARRWIDLGFRAEGDDQGPGRWISTGNTAAPVSDGPLPAVVTDDVTLLGDERAAAERTLADGGAVVFTTARPAASAVRVVATWSDLDGSGGETTRRTTVPATFVHVGETAQAPTPAVLSRGAARRLGLPVTTTALLLDRPMSHPAQTDIEEGLRAIGNGVDWPTIYVERGYPVDSSARLIQWVLAGLGALLMLGGTLTATFLALSDAKPDLATLAAVGARPRTRRGVAAAYALVVALVGAVLGAAIGFVPGIAVTYPLTMDGTGGGPFIDVPWTLVVGLVLGLPLLVAGIVALATRSRLPMVARLE